MKVRHGYPIGKVMPAKLHLDLEFLIDGKLLRAEEGEHFLTQFIHKSVSYELPISEFRCFDFHCDSFQATVSHEKVSDAGGSGCNCLSHPSMILADPAHNVNPVSFQTFDSGPVGHFKVVLFINSLLTETEVGVILKYRINLLKLYLDLPNRAWDRFGGKIDEKHEFDYEDS